MNPRDLDAIQARADAATEGPWRPVNLRHQHGVYIAGRGVYIANVLASGTNASADAEFIAHSRTDVPDLVAELRAARRFDQEAFEVIEGLLDWMKRRQQGDPKLHPEEFFRLTEWAQRVLDDYDLATKETPNG